MEQYLYQPVYHYCSIDTLFSIIQNKTLRLSQISKSNDSKELIWITQYIDKIFEDEFDKEAQNTNYFKERYPKEVYMNLVKQYKKDFFDEDKREYEQYACCFSLAGNDVLSQWRGYTDDGKGVSITFNGSLLSNIGKPEPDDPVKDKLFGFQPVIYDETQQKRKIKKIIQYLIRELKKVVNAQLEKESTIIQKSDILFYRCFRSLFDIAAIMKNPFFKEEKECRLWYTTISCPEDMVDIQIGNGLYFTGKGYSYRRERIASHIDMCFKNYKHPLICGVTIVACPPILEPVPKLVE